jgi:uncharacterized protein
MHTIHITLLFAGLCALMQCLLTAMVIAQRVQKGIDLQDGGDASLMRHIRTHANFSETVPICLLLLLSLELGGLGPTWLWLLGLALLTGRVLHACGMLIPALAWGRLSGMILTLTVMSFEGALCIWLFLR